VSAPAQIPTAVVLAYAAAATEAARHGRPTPARIAAVLLGRGWVCGPSDIAELQRRVCAAEETA
jgi:hypothetical protein